MIKVLIVDDSIFMRNIISDMLSEERDIEIIGKARNGKDAVRMNKELKPDVITMDVEMPVMNGIEAVKHIMVEEPTKIIMLSSLTVEGARETIEALENGAFDFLAKPSGSISLDIRKVKEKLIEKIKLRANVKNLRLKPHKEKVKLGKFLKHDGGLGKEKDKTSKKVVAIGISTGGPKALQEIIPELPKDLSAGVLVVQHMPPKFTKSLANRLDLLSDVRVKEGEDGDIILAGHVYIAPGGSHMEVVEKGGKKIIEINKKDLYSGHRPSANVLFRSVAKVYGKNSVGVIMTGMGGDGAEYLKEIRNLGGKTIAQSKDTCVVYGMPRVAVESEAVDYVIDLKKIPNKILELLKR